jgi:hypothetical protein
MDIHSDSRAAAAALFAFSMLRATVLSIDNQFH